MMPLMPISRAALEALPKIELHVHLEGTVDADTARTLAANHSLDPSSLPFGDAGYPTRFDSFQHFVDCYLGVCALIRTPDDLGAIAAAFAKAQQAQNVLYTEVTFTALTHVRNGMEPKAMWQAVSDGFAEADTHIRLIVDAVRDMGPQHGTDTVALVEAADADICALGLTGIEGSTPEREFRMLSEAAQEMGLGLTIHAGETKGPEIVRAALDDLGAQRIGHGVGSMPDDELVARLVKDFVPVEVCPTSNVVLGVFPSLEEHPFPEMWKRGMNVTVNSDDPPFFSTTLTDELENASRLAALEVADVAELQRRAAHAAFCSQDVKGNLLAAIGAWEEEHTEVPS